MTCFATDGLLRELLSLVLEMPGSFYSCPVGNLQRLSKEAWAHLETHDSGRQPAMHLKHVCEAFLDHPALVKLPNDWSHMNDPK